MNKPTYKEIFERKVEIAKDVVCNYMSEQDVAKKYGCNYQLVQTFVREFKATLPAPEAKTDTEPPIKRSTGVMGLIDAMDNYHEFMDTMKDMYIKRKLQHSGSLTAAARKMGLERSTVYTIINKSVHINSPINN